jgi:hypothetical protein
MKYEEIKKYFENKETGLVDLLNDTKDVRDAIEDYIDQFMKNIVTSADDYKEALNKVTGYYGFVITVAVIADVYADSEEANIILNTKKTPIDDGTGKMKAPTDELVKATGKTGSAEYKRIASLFESYAKKCEKIMMTVQSQLNRIEFEWKSKQS